MAVAEPQKELRFTRSGQAVPFWLAAAVFAAATITLIAVSFYRKDHPALPNPLWTLIPALLCWLSLRTALRCTKHAYLILSPLGVEVFPFFRPVTGMQMIPWAQIVGAEVSGRVLTLHYNDDRSSGVHLSLSPIAKARRPLLERAIIGRLEKSSPGTSQTIPT